MQTCVKKTSRLAIGFKADTFSLSAKGEGISTCRSKGPKGEIVQRSCDCVVASHSFQEKNKNMDVLEEFESRPHKAVTFLVEGDTEFQVWREQKMPKGATRIQWRKPARKKQG